MKETTVLTRVPPASEGAEGCGLRARKALRHKAQELLLNLCRTAAPPAALAAFQSVPGPIRGRSPPAPAAISSLASFPKGSDAERPPPGIPAAPALGRTAPHSSVSPSCSATTAPRWSRPKLGYLHAAGSGFLRIGPCATAWGKSPRAPPRPPSAPSRRDGERPPRSARRCRRPGHFKRLHLRGSGSSLAAGAGGGLSASLGPGHGRPLAAGPMYVGAAAAAPGGAGPTRRGPGSAARPEVAGAAARPGGTGERDAASGQGGSRRDYSVSVVEN